MADAKTPGEPPRPTWADIARGSKINKSEASSSENKVTSTTRGITATTTQELNRLVAIPLSLSVKSVKPAKPSSKNNADNGDEPTIQGNTSDFTQNSLSDSARSDKGNGNGVNTSLARALSVNTTAEENENIKKKRAEDRAAFFRALQSDDTELIHEISWDCLLVWHGASWKVHRQDLREKSAYFEMRLPPVDPTNPRITVDIRDLDLGKLNHVMDYYNLSSKSSVKDTILSGRHNALPSKEDPMDANCIYLNVEMYLAAKMVRYHEMEDFALRNIEDAAHIYKRFLVRCQVGRDILRLEGPLRRAIVAMFHAPYVYRDMEPLRLAMARLVDAVLLFLWYNPYSAERVMQAWFPTFFRQLLIDNRYFRERGWILSRPDTWRPFELHNDTEQHQDAEHHDETEQHDDVEE